MTERPKMKRLIMSFWNWNSARLLNSSVGRQSCALSANARSLYNSSILRKDDVSSKDEKDEWWFRKMLRSSTKLDTPSTAQSRLLSELDSVYEIQIHKVRPEMMQDYLEDFGKFIEMMSDKNTGAKLMGSFTVMIGDQDEALHLWKFKGGYPAYNQSLMIYRTDADILAYRLARNKMLRERYNQILLRFGFWEFETNREPGNMYEMRSYQLKSGSMIEWGNHWARGLKHRQHNQEAVCGFFSHIGELNRCHHLWAYKDLQARKEIRDAAWQRPGWDENVKYTVPLIRSLQSRILIPTPFSPLQ